MFSFLKAITGFGSKADDNVLTVKASTAQLIKEAFNDSNEELNEDLDSIGDGLSNGLNINQMIGNGFVAKDMMIEDSDDEWNEDWNAFEDKTNEFGQKMLEIDCKSTSIKGVVTQVMESKKKLVIDDDKEVKYDCCSFGDISVGDLVNVETNKDNEITVKPLRYKILTGKVSEDQEWHKRFIFCRHAFLRKTSETKHLRVGDVIKCLVIETRNNAFSWRAMVYNKEFDPEVNNVDQIQSFTDELLENKDSIEIISSIAFGDMKLNSKKSILIWIKNNGKKVQTLLSCECEDGEHLIDFKSFQQNYGKPSERPFVIAPKKECFVELSCEAKYCGEHNELMVFTFEGFKIGRFVTVSVHDLSEDQPIRGNRFDGKQFKRRIFGDDTIIVPGERVWNPNKHILDKLEKYRIPDKLWKSYENNWPIDGVFPELKEPLDKDNYRRKFHALVYLEEYDNELNLRKFDMSGVTFRREGRFLALPVPGLADGRPSLIISDKILVFDDKNQTKGRPLVFEGFIHEIRKSEIFIRFNDDFHKDFNGGLFKVMFQMGRMTYRRCHHAIDLSPHMVEQVLFPNKVIIKKPFKRIPIESIQWFNQSLNLQQRLAVVGALRGESRPTPYIIFGPPGTGKTVTIVESILQVFDKIPHSRVIACTSANSSADLIAQKLLESGQITDKDLIRVTALHRVNQIPEYVKSVTKIAEEDEKKWLYHRVIVTTTSQAGVIFKYKISPSHFTHAFIDEAAQVIEPESLIPISMSVIGHGVVVLAGDHKQLGPVVQSMKAKSERLDRSLMERLMTCCPPYQRENKYQKFGYYNPKFVTKLVQNYRSDHLIMHIPSQLFYENELQFNVKRDEQLIESLNFKSPIIFTGVKGEDRQDTDCPSWYNPQEIIQTCSYLDLLYESGVKPEEIGIITPYRKQVTRIRTHIQDMGLVECRVATIEEFQGLEKRVIIVSMVRSSPQNLDHDLKYNLGFIHNSKRFNVAISRAMALLICVGDPFLLCRDKCWSQLLDHCIFNEGYNGCQFREFEPKPLVRKRSKIMG